jgi:two-component system NtrC family sensor kinase
VADGGLRADEGSLGRVLVLRPPAAGGGPGVGARDSGEWARALKGLDRGVAVEMVSDADTCLARCAGGEVHVVVVDAGLAPGQTRAVLDALRAAGPPVVVAGGARDPRTLAAWRAQGAADCVAATGEALRDAVRAALEHTAPATDAMAYQTIVQSLNSALLVVDPNGRVAFCNPPAEQILGVASDRVIGRPASQWFRGGEDAADLLARALAAGERFKAAEMVLHRDDGRVVPVGVSCAPVHDAEGRIAGAVALFQDLSEVTRMRSHVLQREKMASIGQLAAGVAHEINNPMGFIHANLFQMTEYVADLRQVWSRVETLQKAALSGDASASRAAAEALAAAADEADVAYLLSDLAKAIRESQEGSERIRHIVQDLRDFSHADTTERVLSDVNQCLDSTANIVWPMMKHVVVLEKDYATLPDVLCYPMQLKQVFMNLLVNAYQAIESKVGDSGEVGTIRLSSAQKGHDVVVAVSDSGVGISEDDRRRIFEPFFTTKKVGSGMGLGLSTSFNLIERHGGSLTVESEPGVGTTFRVRLPLRASQEEA